MHLSYCLQQYMDIISMTMKQLNFCQNFEMGISLRFFFLMKLDCFSHSIFSKMINEHFNECHSPGNFYSEFGFLFFSLCLSHYCFPDNVQCFFSHFSVTCHLRLMYINMSAIRCANNIKMSNEIRNMKKKSRPKNASSNSSCKEKEIVTWFERERGKKGAIAYTIFFIGRGTIPHLKWYISFIIFIDGRNIYYSEFESLYHRFYDKYLSLLTLCFMFKLMVLLREEKTYICFI